ncbi:MAG: hypothetical protein HWE10_06525 [Gammaproteobacteria bacterium]|nr:hypothetical protein [Gammaproteobacteria bacterium]
MKKLVALFAATLFTAQASALSTDYKFVGVDATTATNVCLIAAESGFSAAQKAAKEDQNYDLYDLEATSCNGVNIKRFAKKFQQKAAPVESTKVIYKFKALDNTEATQVCAIAAEQGIKQARQVAGSDANLISCNGKSLTRFARQYKNS